MKFQCGECKKYFTINNSHNVNDELEFQCDKCSNKFTINRNLVFSSSSKNSNILCENCGKLIPESNKVCDSCNLILNKTHEELRIDNKYYESLSINGNGDVCSANTRIQIKNNKNLMPRILAVVVIILALVGYLIGTNNLPFINAAPSLTTARIETQIILMQSGQTYYADEVKEDGVNLRITNKNGTISKVLKSDVLQISKAVIEN